MPPSHALNPRDEHKTEGRTPENRQTRNCERGPAKIEKEVGAALLLKERQKREKLGSEREREEAGMQNDARAAVHRKAAKTVDEEGRHPMS